MNEDGTKKYQFYAALSIVLICIAYLFICAWHKPVIDLTAPVLSLITLLVGYYWGSSKGSVDKSDTINTMASKPSNDETLNSLSTLNKEIKDGQK